MRVEAAYVFAAQLLTREVYSLGQEHPTQYHINTHTHSLSLSLSIHASRTFTFFYIVNVRVCFGVWRGCHDPVLWNHQGASAWNNTVIKVPTRCLVPKSSSPAPTLAPTGVQIGKNKLVIGG
jgi:hypothetical protein